MFPIDNTKSVMIQPARTIGRGLPIRAVSLHHTISYLKDLSGIPKVTQENERRTQLPSKTQPPHPPSHYNDAPTPSAGGPDLGCFHIQSMRMANVKYRMIKSTHCNCSECNRGPHCVIPSVKGLWDVLGSTPAKPRELLAASG